MKVFDKLLAYTLLTLCVVPVVSAAGFSEGFKNWLLEPQASELVAKADIVRLDAVSAECMQCHNSKDSGHIILKSANSSMQFAASGRQSNHPVGMNYDEYVVRQPASFRSRAMLNPNISFSNGQVTCVSCHEQKDRKELSYTGLSSAGNVHLSKKEMCTSRKTLTVGPKKSDLCMSCHAM